MGKERIKVLLSESSRREGLGWISRGSSFLWECEVLNSCPERLWMPRPSLEGFKARLDGALGSLGCYEMWRLVALPVVVGWSFVILEVPSNPTIL